MLFSKEKTELVVRQFVPKPTTAAPFSLVVSLHDPAADFPQWSRLCQEITTKGSAAVPVQNHNHVLTLSVATGKANCLLGWIHIRRQSTPMNGSQAPAAAVAHPQVAPPQQQVVPAQHVMHGRPVVNLMYSQPPQQQVIQQQLHMQNQIPQQMVVPQQPLVVPLQPHVLQQQQYTQHQFQQQQAQPVMYQQYQQPVTINPQPIPHHQLHHQQPTQPITMPHSQQLVRQPVVISRTNYPSNGG
eukprot:c8654_g1_i5.p2 GENE.c8654_g1_i5~~c8654_g1_i5.p2  ORF type:complete len:242 (-),score=51.00 c8654_g1_i5:44-769(-)